MFKTEEELVKKFIKIFNAKYGRSYIRKEVKTNYSTKTDIVIKKKNKAFSFEAKLNNIVDVWIQALRNKQWYDHSYVILPFEKKKLIIEKHLNIFKENNIGVVLVANNDIEFLNKIDYIL